MIININLKTMVKIMKIFLDTAHVKDIKKWVEMGLLDGVTTNPSHLSKEGTDPKKIILEICALLPDGEISVEVTEKEPEAVYRQAKEIAALADNIVVKIPCHLDYYPVIKKLVEEDIKINVTLVFTLIQSLMMCKLHVHYISPFVGRWDDIDVEGSDILCEIRQMIDQYDFNTQLLAASLRNVRHIHQAILSDVDIITVPADLLEKSLIHPLTNQGIEKFNTDWQKLGIKQFP